MDSELPSSQSEKRNLKGFKNQVVLNYKLSHWEMQRLFSYFGPKDIIPMYPHRQ